MPLATACRMIFGRESEPRCEVAPRPERLSWRRLHAQHGRPDRPDARDRRDPPADVILTMPLHQLGLDLFEARLDRGVLPCLEAEEIPRHLGQGVILEHALDECIDVLTAGGPDDAEL